MNRIIADTGKAKQHWERRCDELPYLMVPMSNGTIVRYNPEIQQPAFIRALENIRNMKTGYGFSQDPGGTPAILEEDRKEPIALKHERRQTNEGTL